MTGSDQEVRYLRLRWDAPAPSHRSGRMTRLRIRLRAAWRWYREAIRYHEHHYNEGGECECGKLVGDW